MRNKLLSLCLVLLLLAAFPLTAAALDFAPEERGSLSVTLVSQSEELTLAGAELSVFHVADVQCGADGSLR